MMIGYKSKSWITTNSSHCNNTSEKQIATEVERAQNLSKELMSSLVNVNSLKAKKKALEKRKKKEMQPQIKKKITKRKNTQRVSNEVRKIIQERILIKMDMT
eukprot:TRINITY_DN9484_c0_g1_i1.p2 TRINITY_DN9484_c0_g1~~TRINITY_DN9484_c0_g1_i1.p2  ORF type:complete len:102 (-),score=16.46 TRINITY_DN9484_c0_g1_i1:1077-1382(-)